MTIETKQSIDQLMGRFDGKKSWEERYSEIVKMGRELPAMADSDKTENNRIKGCLSQVWLTAKLDDGKVYFSADSDALIVKGIIALLVNALSGMTPQEIVQTDFGFLDQIGLRQHLSMNRSNGLTSMLKQLKLYGLAFSTQV